MTKMLSVGGILGRGVVCEIEMLPIKRHKIKIEDKY